MSSTPTTSLIVIAYNEARRLPATLASIGALDDSEGLEIIVVDDGSTDATHDVANRFARADSRVVVVPLGRNRGRGAARQAGVDAARGSQIGFVDADILLPADWLRRCREALSDDVVAAGGVAVPDGDAAYLVNGLGFDAKPSSHPEGITGSNCLIDGPRLRAVGVDPTLSDGEDVDLARRLLAAGGRVITLPGLEVEHVENKGFRGTARWMWTSGRGAQRAIHEGRAPLRFPDLVFAAWAVSTLATVVSTRGVRRLLGVAPLVAVGAAHAHRSAVLTPSPRSVLAVLADAAHVGSYFGGRVREALTRVPLPGNDVPPADGATRARPPA